MEERRMAGCKRIVRIVFRLALVAAVAAVILVQRRISQMTWTIPVQPVAQFPILVTDSLSGEPVAGAIVRPMCLGGTPYVFESYETGTTGLARVFYFAQAGGIGLDVSAAGYSQASIWVWTNSLLVRLER